MCYQRRHKANNSIGNWLISWVIDTQRRRWCTAHSGTQNRFRTHLPIPLHKGRAKSVLPHFHQNLCIVFSYSELCNFSTFTMPASPCSHPCVTFDLRNVWIRSNKITCYRRHQLISNENLFRTKYTTNPIRFEVSYSNYSNRTIFLVVCARRVISHSDHVCASGRRCAVRMPKRTLSASI